MAFTTYEKKITDRKTLKSKDIDFLCASVLEDMVNAETSYPTPANSLEYSIDLLKNKTTIDAGFNYNLSELNKTSGKKLLITYAHNETDPRNVVRTKSSLTYESSFHLVYTINLTMLVSSLGDTYDNRRVVLPNITDIIVNNLSNNGVGSIQIDVPYSATHNRQYTIDLLLSKMDDPIFLSNYQDNTNPGYVRALLTWVAVGQEVGIVEKGN
jgi:hypothetical protein